MDKKTTLQTWFQKVWTEEDDSVIHKMFIPDDDGAADGLDKNKGLGPDDFLVFHKALLGFLREMNIHIDHSLESGDTIIASCTIHAKDRKTGTKKIEVKGVVVGRIVDGVIKDAQNHFDFLNMFEDLGLLPENTFATCLGGQPIGL